MTDAIAALDDGLHVSSDFFVAETIVDDRVANDGTLWYLVQWQGLGDPSCTWEPVDILKQTCSEKISEYEEKKGKNPTEVKRPEIDDKFDDSRTDTTDAASNVKMSDGEVENDKSEEEQKPKRKRPKLSAHKLETTRTTRRDTNPPESKKRKRESEPNVYEVEKIVDKKKKFGVVWYLVKWVGYNSASNTWELEENLEASCAAKIRDYEKRMALAGEGNKEYTLAAIKDKKRKYDVWWYKVKWRENGEESWEPCDMIKSSYPEPVARFERQFAAKQSKATKAPPKKPQIESEEESSPDEDGDSSPPLPTKRRPSRGAAKPAVENGAKTRQQQGAREAREPPLERILGERLDKGETFYLVKWQYGKKPDSWEPRSRVMARSPTAIRRFEMARRKKRPALSSDNDNDGSDPESAGDATNSPPAPPRGRQRANKRNQPTGPAKRPSRLSSGSASAPLSEATTVEHKRPEAVPQQVSESKPPKWGPSAVIGCSEYVVDSVEDRREDAVSHTLSLSL
eukprot:c16689_g1_i2.p1 GENE.c16689_g1_i2~~c16689_g1_i2.p1  ORF type:complete len:522 (-),score=112.30 c16689_g1_i2:452-1987(-)